MGGLGSFAGGGNQGGRGPKNWQRSDERIKEDVNERLTEHSQIDATEIEVQVRKGEVTIACTLEDRRIKRMVEDLIKGVSGAKDVHNQLRASQVGAHQENGSGGEVHATGAQTRK